jgi:hypothetical protein
MANFSHVQSASNQGDPASATFASTPTEGNLLVEEAIDCLAWIPDGSNPVYLLKPA